MNESTSPVNLLSKEALLLVVALALLGWLCVEGLTLMVGWWDREEYSHGYMIPFVALFLLWQKRFKLAEQAQSGSWLGVMMLIAAIGVWLLGELSAIYTLIQYAFLVGVYALALLWVGWRGLLVIWAPITYLVFMIPLPNFLFFNLSQELQLISSSLGVAVVRMFDISVYLAGNVIDLGVYQLEVVEACNGLRYLFPLMSFGFLIAYIYKGPVWQKVVLFLSTIPITVLMNSFRIGVIGITVEHFGIAAAEGFLHDFEGWIIFMSCIGVLLVEVWLFYLMSDRSVSFGDILDLDFGRGEAAEMPSSHGIKTHSTMWIGLAILIASLPLSTYLAEREDIVPERSAFIDFSLRQGEWDGRITAMEPEVLEELKLSDYMMANFYSEREPHSVGFYTAWYEIQRKGASIHSPKSCLPGGGWVIKSHTIDGVEGIDAYGADLQVNRVVMQMAEHTQLVYYWFQGRGRNITNEYAAKWYIFWDSLTRQRTDGALVRLVTYVPEGSDIAEADQRLQGFLETIYPQLPAYIPD